MLYISALGHDILQTIGFSLLTLTCTPIQSTMEKKIASYASSPKAKETIFRQAKGKMA